MVLILPPSIFPTHLISIYIKFNAQKGSAKSIFANRVSDEILSPRATPKKQSK